MEGQGRMDSQTILKTVPRVDSDFKWVKFSPTEWSDPALLAKIDRGLGIVPVEKITEQTNKWEDIKSLLK